jgi:hypothetical protein
MSEGETSQVRYEVGRRVGYSDWYKEIIWYPNKMQTSTYLDLGTIT